MKPEMYWNAATPSGRSADTPDPNAYALRAVQVSLDRRDNGGDTRHASEHDR